MKLREIIKNVDWSTVCTVASCLGVVGTGIFAALGGAKISKEWDPKKPRGEKAKIVLKHEWPAVLCGAVTIGLDILGHHLDKKTILELTALSGMGAKKINDYREEVARTIGPEAERDISERVNKRWIDEGVEYHLEELSHTFYEPVTETFFDCPTSVLYEAVAQLNKDLFVDPYFMGIATMSDFFIRMEQTRLCGDISDKAGWYAPDVPGGQILFSLDYKRDPVGKKYWIICWDRMSEPSDDVKRDLYLRGKEFDYE